MELDRAGIATGDTKEKIQSFFYPAMDFE